MTIDISAVVATSAQLTVLLAALGGAVIWLKKWIKSQVAEPLASVQAQVTSNNGASMKDAVDGTALTIGRIETKIDTLTRRFEDHLVFGHGGGPRDGG